VAQHFVVSNPSLLPRSTRPTTYTGCMCHSREAAHIRTTILAFSSEQRSRLTAAVWGTLNQVEAARREFPIDDYGVSQTSLEQVFVRFAQQQPAALPPCLADAAPRRSCELSPASSNERE